ncbi:MAG: T9SS type A sorting domain-containing protein [Bacteroidota bacterium]
MKKLFTLMILALMVYSAQAQNCQADFSVYADSMYTAYFTDQSTAQSGNVVSWSWSFPGGVPSTSASQNPIVTWSIPGTYIVCLTISTDDSCSSTYCDSVQINYPCQGFYADISVTLTSGQGVADGSATANVTGGTPPYLYFWNNAASTQTIDNLTEGFYCVSVTDAIGCSYVSCDSVYCYLDTICNINVTAYIMHETTIGAANGSIDITVLWGGTPPYTFNWSNGATTEDISGLSQGYYSVTILDSDTCMSTETYYVWCDTTTINPCQMYVTGSITHVSYAGGNDGAINVTVIGGTPPFTYYWNTGAVTEDISGLTTGVYTVEVNDSQTCSTTATFYVNEPTAPTQWDTIYSGVIDTCVGFVYDSIYVYSWYMIDSVTVNVTWAATGGGQVAFFDIIYYVPQPGNYYTVLSINCGTKALETFIGHIFVDYSMLTGIENTPELLNISLYPNPVNEKLNLEIPLAGNANMNISILNISGQAMYQGSFDFSKGINKISINTEALGQGMYFVRISGDGMNQTIKFIK